MRVLIISDIHANMQALDACLEAFPAYDIVWNLGDVVGYGANPNEAIARCRELGKTFVRGNHDKACSGVTDLVGFNPVAAMAAIWTKKNLTPENLEWLKALPQGPISPDIELNVACVHGSPLDEDQYLINVHEATEPLLHPAARCTFFGHTHLQGAFLCHRNGVRRLNGADPESNEEGIALENDVNYLINPGSVGQPRDGDWRAAFAWFDSESLKLVFHRAAYDIERAQQRILEANLPPRLASRLAIGR